MTIPSTPLNMQKKIQSRSEDNAAHQKEMIYQKGGRKRRNSVVLASMDPEDKVNLIAGMVASLKVEQSTPTKKRSPLRKGIQLTHSSISKKLIRNLFPEPKKDHNPTNSLTIKIEENKKSPNLEKKEKVKSLLK